MRVREMHAHTKPGQRSPPIRKPYRESSSKTRSQRLGADALAVWHILQGFGPGSMPLLAGRTSHQEHSPIQMTRNPKIAQSVPIQGPHSSSPAVQLWSPPGFSAAPRCKAATRLEDDNERHRIPPPGSSEGGGPKRGARRQLRRSFHAARIPPPAPPAPQAFIGATAAGGSVGVGACACAHACGRRQRAQRAHSARSARRGGRHLCNLAGRRLGSLRHTSGCCSQTDGPACVSQYRIRSTKQFESPDICTAPRPKSPWQALAFDALAARRSCTQGFVRGPVCLWH